MTSIDLTPLYRTMVGIDRMATMIDSASRFDGAGDYPPYNVTQIGDNDYAIEIAAAGFSEDELDLELKEGVLRVSGKKTGDNRDVRYLYRGIAKRQFTLRYQLADHVQVEGAQFVDGVLRIALLREIPDILKPRKIPIGAATRKLDSSQTQKEDISA